MCPRLAEQKHDFIVNLLAFFTLCCVSTDTKLHQCCVSVDIRPRPNVKYVTPPTSYHICVVLDIT